MTTLMELSELREALEALLSAQKVSPYRGWSITELNKAADRARELLGLPSVRDLNPDIATMQDIAFDNRDVLSKALAATPSDQPLGEMEPLGEPFTRIWDENREALYESEPSSDQPLREALEGQCTCAEVCGENPDCVKHGNGTVFALTEALQTCRAQFEFYVQSHLAKQPPDMDKAATNQEFVELCDAALSSTNSPVPDGEGEGRRGPYTGSMLSGCMEFSERQETTLEEVAHRAREGKFYEDYDWASGPALRALDRAVAALKDREG